MRGFPAAAAFAALAALAAPLPALACRADPGDDSWDEHTICPEHYPADAPRFEDYPAKSYRGPVAPPRWRADAASRHYRTRLREAAQQRPNFGGRYIMAHWGCGTNCLMNALIDARSGKVYHLPGAGMNFSHNVHDSLVDDGGLLRYRADSRLFVLVGSPQEEPGRRGISFFEWTGSRMKLLRHVAVP